MTASVLERISSRQDDEASPSRMEDDLMVNTKETMLDWLRDAHAMENANIKTLEGQVKKFDNNPNVVGKLREHLETTRSQKERLEGVIKQLGGDVSKIKDMTGTFLSATQGAVSLSAPDAIVKSALSNYATESFEIACYQSLVAAADAQNMPDVKRVCQAILDEEREMASWLEHHIPRLTNEYLGTVKTMQK